MNKAERFSSSIPEYWKRHLIKKIEIIKKHKASADNHPSFGLIADIHWDTNTKHSASLLKCILDECEIPCFFNAGDLFSGYGICSHHKNIEEFSEYHKVFEKIQHKCLMVEGNHDAVYSLFEAPDYYAQNIPLSLFNEHYFGSQSLYPDRVFGKTGTYYYADDKQSKTRFIVLNTHDIPSDETTQDGRPVYNKFRKTGTGFLQKQLDWFANVALDVPSSDWTVVLCTHEAPVYTREDAPDFDLVCGIIDAFRRHTSFECEKHFDKELSHYDAKISIDFTGKGGNFAVWVSGHVHKDMACYVDGILVVSSICDCLSESYPDKVPGTDTEQSFDIFTIDKENHRIFATRIGYGKDREFEYEVF